MQRRTHRNRGKNCKQRQMVQWKRRIGLAVIFPAAPKILPSIMSERGYRHSILFKPCAQVRGNKIVHRIGEFCARFADFQIAGVSADTPCLPISRKGLSCNRKTGRYNEPKFEIAVRYVAGRIDLEFVNIYKPPEGGLVDFTLQTALPSEDDLCV